MMDSADPISCSPGKCFSIKDDGGEVLPGFRFHPTDEELVGFYLQRKVAKKPLSIDLIRQVDIYKYEPWDLPMSTVGDKEWYFFCIRGRKYRNSVRPNRVTGSGFWKATGIDKPIYSSHGLRNCIGLKKSLVYYRGSAGKGTKTDWMMHEFRLPPTSAKSARTSDSSTNNGVAQEAEVWTICRILRRTSPNRKYAPTMIMKDTGNNVANNCIMDNLLAESSSKTSSIDSGCTEQNASLMEYSFNRQLHHIRNPNGTVDGRRNSFTVPATPQFTVREPYEVQPYNYPLVSIWNANRHGDLVVGCCSDWDELRSVVERAVDPSYAHDIR